MEMTSHILLILMLVPFFGFLFVLMSQEDKQKKIYNGVAVAEFAVCCNILLLGKLLTEIDLSQNGLQFLSSYNWLEQPHIKISFGIDIFSLMIALAIHLMLVIGLPFAKNSQHPKLLISLSLLMISLLTGFLISADIFSFYIFFTAMLFPLFVLIGTVGEIRKSSWMFRFFIYNFLGSIILFLVVCTLYQHHPQTEGILLEQVAKLRLPRIYEYWIWGGIFAALLSRIPIWPFHYWIASITGAIQNPLAFLLVNLIPLTGVYGLVRFCPKTVPESVSYMLTVLEIIAAISMLFIAMIGLINKDNRYKLFSFMTVYYIIFLLGALLPTNRILLNIGYSIFAFLIIITVLEVLADYIREEQQRNNLNFYGILCYSPRIALLYSFFTLAAVGFPLSALFINNFVILSYLFRYNFNLGLVIMIAIIVSSASLLKELYLLKDNRYVHPDSVCISDISRSVFIGLSSIGVLLLISFFNPLLGIGG